MILKNKIQKRSKYKQAGFSIIEVMVAIGLLAIVMASSAKVIILSMQANKTTRTYASVSADVQDIIDSYRGQNFNSLLALFATDYSTITNGQTVTTTYNSARSRANYNIELTAQKSTSNSNPEIIQVRVLAEHRRGVFNNADYEFMTLISQAK